MNAGIHGVYEQPIQHLSKRIGALKCLYTYYNIEFAGGKEVQKIYVQVFEKI